MWAQKSVPNEASLFAPMNAWPSHVRGQVEAAVARPGDAAVLQLDFERFEQLRAEDKQSFELTLPRPAGRDGDAPEWLTFELERFFVHPEVVTVGLTSERGFEEQDYVPQLQTFTLNLNDNVVGTLVLMHDHVLGSFHHDGQQFDLTQVQGDVYAVLDFNKRTNLDPLPLVTEDAFPAADLESFFFTCIPLCLAWSAVFLSRSADLRRSPCGESDEQSNASASIKSSSTNKMV